MAKFIDNDVYADMSVEEKQKAEVQSFLLVEWICMFIEFVFGIGYCITFGLSLPMPLFLQVPVILVMIIAVAAIIIVQQMFFNRSIKLYFEGDITSAIIYGLLTIGLSVAILYGDIEGGKFSINAVNGYTPSIKKDYSEDARYSTSSTEREKIEREKKDAYDKADKAYNDCSPCKTIEAKYAAKIKPHKASKNPKWVEKENQSIDNQNAQTRKERDAAIAAEKEKLAKLRDEKDTEFSNKLNGIDSNLSVLKSETNNSNISEKQKKEEREKKNDSAAGWVTIFTQLILPLMRLLIINKKRKEKKTLLEASMFLEAISIFANIERFLESWKYKKMQLAEISHTRRIVNAIDTVEKKKSEIGDDRISFLLERGVKSPQEAAAILRGNQPLTLLPPPITTPLATAVRDDKEEIKALIEMYEMLYDDLETTDDKELCEEKIEALNLLLNDI